jgi:hypothetical protein
VARPYRDDLAVEPEPLICREEVAAIIGALADLVVETRRIREWVEGDDEEEDE